MASCQLKLKGKLSGEVEVKSSSSALFHLYVTHPHQFPNICPSIVQSCRLEQGEFGKNGSVLVWNYSVGGKFYVSKQVVENVDVVNKSATFRCVEGEVMNSYRTILFHLHVIPQAGSDCSLVRWTFEYEKVNEDVDQPTALLDNVLDMTKRADAHFLSNKP